MLNNRKYEEPKDVIITSMNGKDTKFRLLGYNSNGVVVLDADGVKSFIPYHVINYISEIEDDTSE